MRANSRNVCVTGIRMDAKRNSDRPNTTSGQGRLLLRGFLTAALGAAVALQPAVGQARLERVLGARPGDTVTVVAGRHYGTSGLHRFFFGGAHRDLWTTPVRVEVLDMSTYAGGLTPIRRGGAQPPEPCTCKGPTANGMCSGRSIRIRASRKDFPRNSARRSCFRSFGIKSARIIPTPRLW